MKSLFLAAALTCAALPAGATTYAIENVVLPAGGLATAFPATTITIAPAAVQRGHFSIYFRTGPLSLSGDVADFVSFQSGGMLIDATGSMPYYWLKIDLSFAPDGQVSIASLNYAGLSPSIEIEGTGLSMAGLYSPTDNYVCGGSADCRILDARMVQQREPAPLSEPDAAALVLFGLAAVSLRRFRESIVVRTA